MSADDLTADAGGPSERWRAALQAWSIPAEILRLAPASPWTYPPRIFAADATTGADDSPSHRAARAGLDGGGTVLDVGCGGGRSSVPLAAAATAITGVDEQEVMLAGFAAAFEAAGVPHHEVLGRWPDVAAGVAIADVVVCHHVVYNVADIEPFALVLSDHARRRVVVELSARHPMSPLRPLWQHFWGLDRPHGPSADVFVDVVRSLGADPVVERITRPSRKPTTGDASYIEFVRRRLCLGPDRDDEVAVQLALLDPDPHEDIVTVWWPGSAGVNSRS